jgi:hypothetical protein
MPDLLEIYNSGDAQPKKRRHETRRVHTARAKGTVQRETAVRMRVAGATYDEIAAAIGTNKSTACFHVQNALKALKKLEGENAEQVRRVDLERIEVGVKGLWPAYSNGDVKAVHAMCRLLERKAALLGLDLSDPPPVNVALINAPNGTNGHAAEAKTARTPDVLDVIPPDLAIQVIQALEAAGYTAVEMPTKPRALPPPDKQPLVLEHKPAVPASPAAPTPDVDQLISGLSRPKRSTEH